MFYKDPAASPKFPIEHTDKNIKSSDGKLPFLSGQHHPWRRFFSRTVEVTIIVLTFSVCLNNFLAATFPRQLNQMFLMIDSPVIWGAAYHLVFIPLEALMLSIFGTTPAKWLFGIRVLSPAGKPLSMWRAIVREFLVLPKACFLAFRLSTCCRNYSLILG